MARGTIFFAFSLKSLLCLFETGRSLSQRIELQGHAADFVSDSPTFNFPRRSLLVAVGDALDHRQGLLPTGRAAARSRPRFFQECSDIFQLHRPAVPVAKMDLT
jgi:hypothetical protein